MFQATRQRLALWYTMVTAVLLLLFASGFYLYVRTTLIERIDDTLNHVVEVVQRSLVIDAAIDTAVDTAVDAATIDPPNSHLANSEVSRAPRRSMHLNLEASFRDNPDSVDDDHIDLEWFNPAGELLWSTFSTAPTIPLHPNSAGETVHLTPDQLLRQITQRVEVKQQIVGYLRVSHPWFEVTKPTRQLIRDLAVGLVLLVGAVAAIGWLLSGLAMAPIRDSYQRLKQFTADASHELRNPIAVIQTNVQVALADSELDPVVQQQQLKVIERLTRRLGRLVDDLLFLARQDSSVAPLRRDSVSLDELLHEVMEEQQTIAAEKEVALKLDIHEDVSENSQGLYRIQGDRDQLTRLLTNLISNAIQYTPPGGRVSASMQRLKQSLASIQIQIQDTGGGIAEAAIPYLFDRFYRADPARTSGSLASNGKLGDAAGSGLGLAIAKVIVENHQGQIHAHSSPIEGTTFTVTLPQTGSTSMVK